MKNFKKKLGEPGYLNKNCWLIRSLNYAPYSRCQYCDLKFRNCLFLHYQAISLILIVFFFTLSFLIEGRISKLIVISVFTLVIVYGYFFNKSTDKLIQANFTERKAKEALEELTQNLEQKVKEQTKDIQALLEMKSEFLRVVSHQLNTPVSIIKSMLSMMAEGSVKGEKLNEFIKKSYLSSERLYAILSDILVAQSLIGEEEPINLSPCQIEEIIEKRVKHFKIQAEMKGLKITFKKPKESLPTTLADSEMIERIISRLIDNAVLYTEKGGEIEVSINLKRENSKDFIVIKAKDSGIGLTDEEKKKLFTLFYRGQRAISLHPNGSGLGLFIVKNLIEIHQGKIEVQSEGKDKGSTFVITLPVITEV